MNGYNENFEDWVTSGTTYDLYVIQANTLDKTTNNWQDNVQENFEVLIAAPQGSISSGISTVLTAALGTIPDDGTCVTTTSTTTTVWPTTSTTSTLTP